MKCGIGVLCVMVVLVSLADARPSPYKARKRRAYSQVNRGRSQKNATTINEKDRLGNSVIGVDMSSENMSQTGLHVKQDGLELTGLSSNGESQKATAVKIKSADGSEALVASQVNASASRDSLDATRTGPGGYKMQVKADKGNTEISRAHVAQYDNKKTGEKTDISSKLRENESHDVKSVVDNRGNSKKTSKHSKTSQSQSEVHSNGNIDFGYLGIGGGGDTPHAGPAPSNTGKFRNPQRPSDGAGPSGGAGAPPVGRQNPGVGPSPGGRQYADAGPYAGAGSSAGAQQPPGGRPGGVPSPDAGASPPGPYGYDSPHGDSRRTYTGAHQPPAEHQTSASHPPPAVHQPSGAQQPTRTKQHPGTKPSTDGGTFTNMWNKAIGGGKSGVDKMKQWSQGHLASHPSFPSFRRKRAARRFRRAIRRLSES